MKFHILAFFLGLLLFSSCSPRLSPFTQHLYQEFEWTEGDLRKVQFYLSEDIILSRELSGGQAEIVAGEVKIVDGQKIEEIVIRKGTPGVLLSIPRENRFAIGFESDNDKYLTFGPSPRAGDKYVLLASKWNRNTGTVTYDGISYRTSSRSAFATLMIDLKHINQHERNSRVLSGRTVRSE